VRTLDVPEPDARGGGHHVSVTVTSGWVDAAEKVMHPANQRLRDRAMRELGLISRD
jgi:hypothetical protein